MSTAEKLGITEVGVTGVNALVIIHEKLLELIFIQITPMLNLQLVN